MRGGEEQKGHMLHVAQRIGASFGALQDSDMDSVVFLKVREMTEIFRLTEGVITMMPEGASISIEDIADFADPDSYRKKRARHALLTRQCRRMYTTTWR